jgi:hypothetical protein
MKKSGLPFLPCALAAAAWLASTPTLSAQPPDRPPQGNFDATAMRQRMLERLRTQLEITDDSEWKLISERATKVMEARRNAGGSGGPGGGPGFGGPGGSASGGPPPQREDGNRPAPPSADSPSGRGGPPAFSREPNPDLEALRKAIDAKASAAELKSALAKYREARKTKEAELTRAQDDLRQLLSVRQEAIAVSLGLLK